MNRKLTVLVWLTAISMLPAAAPPAGTEAKQLAVRAQAILRTHCYRCHGQEGTVEGGFNYILDREKLVSRGKIVPGQPGKSSLFLRTLRGKMPPPEETQRPSPSDLNVLKRWIEQGAPAASPKAERVLVSESDVLRWILTDLERTDHRARRFLRYLSLAPLANAGAGEDELKTYRQAVAKLINSLSWHPRITIPVKIDPRGLVLRLDLRDYLLDANLWNRLLGDYPYGVMHDTGIARAVLVNTGTRMPVVRADWFVATASRAPLYYELLQLPTNLAELERQLRVDVTANLTQERVARSGFNGSGISRNNRILERHDAMNGAYWRTYDFEAVPQNLLERNLLLPDRRNIFAFPLGPGGAETQFQHAGGEAIFHLPNGLLGFFLVDAQNSRINKGPTEIVSDPKRPDRAVEAGLSCMHCHAQGILPKDDQIRDHVRKNHKAFSRQDRSLVEALYPPVKKMRKLMEEDSQRFLHAVQKTGNRPGSAEVIMAMTLRYEAEVDLPTLAAELGVAPGLVQNKLHSTDNLSRNLGPLRLPGGTVSRQVVIQSFGDLVRALKRGQVLEVGRAAESLSDATAEVDPLETQSSPANAMAITPEGKQAAFASQDRTVRLFDVAAERDLRRCIGHTASLWAVAFSPDGKKVLSGGKDGTIRVWETETARELLKIEAHTALVSALAFSPDGDKAVSAGYDHQLLLWDLKTARRIESFAVEEKDFRYLQSVAFSPTGKLLAVASERTIYVLDSQTGKTLFRLEGHTDWINQIQFSATGKQLLSASDDGTARVWDLGTKRQLLALQGHQGPVKVITANRQGKQYLTGGADATVRLWNAKGETLGVFREHSEPVVMVHFAPGNKLALSGSREGSLKIWKILNKTKN